MNTRHRPPSPTLLALGAAAALSGCDLGLVCTDELRPSVIVEVRDRATGMPAARGATGRSEHESGVLTEFYAIGGDGLTLWGDWHGELPGNHVILVRKPGFLTEVAHADVDADRCHVEPKTVQVTLVRDPRAVPESPVSFTEGPDSAGWRRASAQVQVYGDTLEIKGYARTECTELQAVAFRTGSALHVQVEPSHTPLDSCVNSRQFEAKFTLPTDPTRLLLTNGFFTPVVLFDGEVRPSA